VSVVAADARWELYAAGTEADYFAWWCERHLVQSVDQFAGQPLVLEDWQRGFMGEALAVDEKQRQVWSSVVLVVGRKNGKTAMLSAYALYRLLHDEGQPEILLAASSDKQAGRLFEAVMAYVRRRPELLEQVHLRDYIGEISRVDGGGKILRMASDPSAVHGYNPSLVICDELHAWTKPNHRRAWAALTTAGGARAQTQVFTITTAGEAQDRETSILGRLIDGNQSKGELERADGLTISRNRASRTLVYNYSAPTTDPYDTPAMKLANPASWVTFDYLREQAENPELTDAEVLQLHGCVWAAGINAWITPHAWEGCRDDDALVPEGGAVYVGVDVGLVHDSTAVVAAHRREDGRIVVQARVWAAKADAVAHVTVPGGVVDLELVEDYIRDLIGRYDVREVVYDPRFFERSAQMLADSVVIAPFHQNSSEMADAYQSWYAAVLEGRIAHDGDHVLSSHVMSTAASKSDRGWKISKIRQNQRIDAHVAAVMAHARAEQALGDEAFVL
jgi:phage terminase large subunit-like protein